MLLTRRLIPFVTGAIAMGVSPGLSADSVDGDMLQEYCTKCHNFEDYAGGIDLESITPDNIHFDIEKGEKVIRRLRAGMMPPVGEPRPDVDTMQAFASALEKTIDAKAVISVGRPGLHRLNRTEFSNAIRDLLKVQIDPADYFPADDSSRGFDNQAGTLVLSPALLEACLSAAAKISQLAFKTKTVPTSNMLLSILDMYGIEMDSFGDSTGRLPGLV